MREGHPGEGAVSSAGACTHELEQEDGTNRRMAYLLVAMDRAFSIMYVPETLIVARNAAATAERIASSSPVSCRHRQWTVCQIKFIFLVLTLYRLLRDVDGCVRHGEGGPGDGGGADCISQYAQQSGCLDPVEWRRVPVGLRTPATALSVMVFLSLHEQGIVVVQMFWGLWLFPSACSYSNRAFCRVRWVSCW